MTYYNNRDEARAISYDFSCSIFEALVNMIEFMHNGMIKDHL